MNNIQRNELIRQMYVQVTAAVAGGIAARAPIQDETFASRVEGGVQAIMNKMWGIDQWQAAFIVR